MDLINQQINKNGLIPKTIHYVWVGDKPLTPLAKKCIASWKKYLPDYELKLWNESNSPMTHHYVKAMYTKKKWAFVSDYIRFWVLEREGGIYLDTDTEVLKSFDPLHKHQAFFGQTKDGVTATGVIGSVSHHQVVRDILSIYDNDREYVTSRTSPRTATDVLSNGNYDDVKIYDYRYFNPCDDGELCKNDKLAIAYTRNHWAESWVPLAGLRKILRKLGIMSMIKKITLK